MDAFRYMQQARHIGKIVLTYRNGITKVESPKPVGLQRLHLAENGSYLVTGGLGGFGLAHCPLAGGAGERAIWF